MIKSGEISIIGGVGHVGLPLGAMLSLKGYKVNLIDINQEKIDIVNKGKSPFVEHNLCNILSEAIKKKKIIATRNFEKIKTSKFIIICIGTSVSQKLSLSKNYFLNFIKKLRNYLHPHHQVIIRSSIYPGMFNKIYRLINKNCKNITYCPERITQGNSLKELPQIPQIISGTNEKSLKEVKKLFKKICEKTILCSVIEAELAKLFSNAYRYINFSISNEFYMLSNKLGANFTKIRKIMRKDYKRNYGLANSGFTGGPCLMKDTMQLQHLYKKKNSLFNSAYLINEMLPNYIVSYLKSIKNIKSKTVGILGISFKPENDDIRGSLSIRLLKLLKKNKIKHFFSDEYSKLENDLEKIKLIKISDIIIVATPHMAYKKLKIARNKTIIDLSGHLC